MLGISLGAEVIQVSKLLGDADGTVFGIMLGLNDGNCDDNKEGLMDGEEDEIVLGKEVGDSRGNKLGTLVGDHDCGSDGERLGVVDGSEEGR